ncbi:uncharacterized protein METZ01_LOCUS463983 [marine metagenome]|uniref:Uncharacterized protein n=1 Tax=marine metagenome TaxID=408172 RepID=A0A383AUC8_9ZZZZ
MLYLNKIASIVNNTLTLHASLFLLLDQRLLSPLYPTLNRP